MMGTVLTRDGDDAARLGVADEGEEANLGFRVRVAYGRLAGDEILVFGVCEGSPELRSEGGSSGGGGGPPVRAGMGRVRRQGGAHAAGGGRQAVRPAVEGWGIRRIRERSVMRTDNHPVGNPK
jgi:hypothetical protein